MISEVYQDDLAHLFSRPHRQRIVVRGVGAAHRRTAQSRPRSTHARGGDPALCHCGYQLGLRFSLKLAMPSRASSVSGEPCDARRDWIDATEWAARQNALQIRLEARVAPPARHAAAPSTISASFSSSFSALVSSCTRPARSASTAPKLLLAGQAIAAEAAMAHGARTRNGATPSGGRPIRTSGTVEKERVVSPQARHRSIAASAAPPPIAATVNDQQRSASGSWSSIASMSRIETFAAPGVPARSTHARHKVCASSKKCFAGTPEHARRRTPGIGATSLELLGKRFERLLIEGNWTVPGGLSGQRRDPARRHVRHRDRRSSEQLLCHLDPFRQLAVNVTPAA